MQNDILNHEFPPNLDAIWEKEFALQLAAAQGAISGLSQAVPLLHNPDLLMQPLLDKEAESSSRLEGTLASVEDVYKAELKSAQAEDSDDVRETKNYRLALTQGVHLIKTRPLNQVAVRQIHATLLNGVRGEKKHPGKYRTGDVWIGVAGTGVGDARYVPPSAIHIPQLMDSLEELINSSGIHPLITCGIIHHRFEGVHPFEDGNGRTGRLLITLYLLKTGMLAAPMLYPSGFFEKNKRDYMNALHSVDISQDWSGWLLFFLKGIETQALVSLKVARDIDALYKSHREKLQNATSHIGLLRVLEFCFVQPIVNVKYVSEKLSMNPQTVRRYLVQLDEAGILDLDHVLDRGEKIYSNTKLLELLRQI
ncbi:MAG TPA: Fic family protein [Candidatus Saccharimonadales bacterium]|nr:Fic family protein [Candidatus Saccharimonadales bacterium]